MNSDSQGNAPTLRVLELFCGIGGCAAALGSAGEVVAAVDVDRVALGVYHHNFPGHPVVAATLETLPRKTLGRFRADLWWLSPPCQPYTRRGLGRDLDDPRARGLLALIDAVVALRPPRLALENVPPFRGSRAHARLREVLDGAGYRTREHLLCPSQWGLPNRRRRFYLAAALDGEPAALTPPEPVPAPRPPLAACLDEAPEPDLAVPAGLAEHYAGALHIVDAGDPRAVTACFTSAYGRSPVRSGSYLRAGAGLRRFSPAEVLRLLGFPPCFRLPPEIGRRKGWHLAGNSLSVPVARAVLATLLPAPPDGFLAGENPHPLSAKEARRVS